MKVDVYYNIHKKCLSVRSRERETYGKVIGHVPVISLKNCRFVVSEAGRKRVVKERRKNVHAVVRGETFKPNNDNGLGSGIKLALDKPIPVTYNPYQFTKFMRKDKWTPIEFADVVIINNKSITAYNQAVDIELFKEKLEELFQVGL